MAQVIAISQLLREKARIPRLFAGISPQLAQERSNNIACFASSAMNIEMPIDYFLTGQTIGSFT